MNNDYAKRIAEAVREAAAKKLSDRAVARAIRVEEAIGTIFDLDIDAIIASVPDDAPAGQPEDERERLSAWEQQFMQQRGYPPRPLEIWQAAKRDAAQAQQERVAVTDAEISATARALADRNAEACNVNKDDNWAIYGGDFINDVRFVLLSLAQSKEGGK